MSDTREYAAPESSQQSLLWVGERAMALGIFGDATPRSIRRVRRMLYEAPPGERLPVIHIYGLGNCLRSESWLAYLAEREARAVAADAAVTLPAEAALPPKPRRGRRRKHPADQRTHRSSLNSAPQAAE